MQGKSGLGIEAQRDAIAAVLNERRIRTARGGAWHDSTVRNLLARQQAA
jgi:Recombinase